MPVKNRIQLRRGTSAEWSGSVDILASGEMGWDTTENNIKIGDGSNYWDDLPWLVVAGVSGQVINPSVISGVSGIFLDTSVGDVDLIAGQVGWNSEAGTAEIGLTDDLKIQIGQTVLFRVKNSTGGALSKGQAVYASGVLGGGQIIQAAPFAVDGTVDEVRFIGLMTNDLANGEDGYVNHFGHIKNVDLRTSNTAVNPNGETWAVGDILYVDDGTAGGLTKNAPQDDIYVAMVLADGQNGELFVRITDPGHITDLHDVNISGLVDNNLMVWNSGADYWEPSTNLTFNGSGLQVDDGHIIIDNINTNDPYIKLTGGTTGFLNHTGSALIAWDVSSSLVPKRLKFIIDGTVDSNPILQVTSDNKVSINKSSDPAYELDVVGSGNFSGDVTIDGHLSAATKSFLINHPTEEGKKLQYGSLESPYHGVRLTGRGKTSKGKCVIQLPDYIRELIHDDENINIQITNYKHAKTLYVNDINIKKNNFTVKVGRTRKGEELEFFWSFTAVRKDVQDLIVEK